MSSVAEKMEIGACVHHRLCDRWVGVCFLPHHEAEAVELVRVLVHTGIAMEDPTGGDELCTSRNHSAIRERERLFRITLHGRYKGVKK